MYPARVWTATGRGDTSPHRYDAETSSRCSVFLYNGTSCIRTPTYAALPPRALSRGHCHCHCTPPTCRHPWTPASREERKNSEG
jgi:hypothetical protein